MIVLDEQLLGRGIESAISEWYPGTVCFIKELRPETIIKDESIPALLGQAQQPIFVTINVTDFWQRAELTPRYCLVCVALPDSQAGQIPELLRRLLRHPRVSHTCGPAWEGGAPHTDTGILVSEGEFGSASAY